MKKDFVYILIICALLFTSMALFSLYRNEKQSKDRIESNFAIMQDTLTHYVDREHTLHYQIGLISGTLSDVKATNRAMLDSVTKRLKIKDKQLQSLQSAMIEAKGQFTTLLVHDTLHHVTHDTLPDNEVVSTFTYNDNYLHEVGEVGTDSVTVKYEVLVPLQLTEYSKKKNIFSPRLYFADAYSLNPNAAIKGLTAIRIDKGQPKFKAVKYAAVFLFGFVISKL